MPNHIQNKLEIKGTQEQIYKVLDFIKIEDDGTNDVHGIGTIDFNKIIPIPESLNIASGSYTNNGLKVYRDFIGMYLFGKNAADALKALENIPQSSEEAFLKARADCNKTVNLKEWELGKAAWHNIQKYGAATWYEWSRDR